jgi:signal transduction histidine kinase
MSKHNKKNYVRTRTFSHTRLAARINARFVALHLITFLIIDIGLYVLYYFGLLSFAPFSAFGYALTANAVAIISSSIIVFLQIVFILNTAALMGGAVRKNLAPIQELLTATEAFADASRSPSGRYSPEALKELARALDAVNAAHLDSRISPDAITEELRPLASAINEMLARIDEAYGAQKRFVSDASHELRTPIAVIQGYANMLLRWGSEDPATLRESVEAIKSEADAMKQMVNQLLFLARGDNESMNIDWQAVCLTDVVKEVVREEAMIDEAQAFNIKLISEDGLKVYGDSGLLKQLTRILLDNSIKYSEAGGSINVRLAADGFGKILLSVSDEGKGIPNDILPHIFDRFVRADDARTRSTGGSGLGLSIAKWIAEKHGGHIEVVSVEGIGTKFTVILPFYR